MSVRFIIGLAGTGKTRHCIDALVGRSLAEPLGPPLLWLVPEQATFMSEQLILSNPRMRGAFRIEVLGFRRLCQMIAEEIGITSLNGGIRLSEIARLLLLSRAVDQCVDQLVLFKQVTRESGFLHSLDRILRELQQADHHAASLDEIRRRLTEQGEAGSILDRKLHDLSILLTAWQKNLGEEQCDPDRLPQLIADRLGDSKMVRSAHIWIDSFSALSVLELNLLTAMARQSMSMEITLLADPTSPIFRNPDAPLNKLSTFHRTETIYRRLHAAFAKARVQIESTVFLAHPHRFSRTAAMVQIWTELFLRRNDPEDSCSTEFTATVDGSPDDEINSPDVPSIAIWECDTPEVEIIAAAQHIRSMVTKGTVRYRDIGIVVADIDEYEPTIRRIFQTHGIPHFIDRRRPISHHPLVELLRTAVKLIIGGFRQADWLMLLKTDLTGLSEEKIFFLENYLLTHGIDHDDFSRDWHWDARDHDEDSSLPSPNSDDEQALGHANAIRRELCSTLADWCIAAENKNTSGSAMAEALMNLLKSLKVRSRLDTWIQHASDQGQPELALIHQQAWEEVLNLLEVMRQMSPTQTQSLHEFSRLLSAGLETLTLGLIPPALDQVLISTSDRSRHPELIAVIILGSVETYFPHVGSEDPMLDDRQRHIFNLLSTNPIGSGSRINLLEATFFDYVAFTRASRQLIISYPLCNAARKAVTPSQYIHHLKQYARITPRRIWADNADLNHWACLDDVLAGETQWIRAGLRSDHRAAIAESSMGISMSRSEGLALYQWLSTNRDVKFRLATDRAFSALQPQSIPLLSSAITQAFYPGVIDISASQLETFCRCPQQYFFAHLLKLKPRQTPDMDAFSLGILYHQVLQGVYQNIIDDKLSWPDCTQENLLAVLQQQIDGAFKEIEAHLFAASPLIQALRQPVSRNLRALLTMQQLAAKTSGVRPQGVEVAFGSAPRNARMACVPPLNLVTAKGIKIQVSGQIDRLDASANGDAVVIDYKTRETKLDMNRLYSGLSIQLPLYLLVLRQPETRINGQYYRGFAAFYQGIIFKPKLPAGDGEKLIAAVDPRLYSNLKPDGFFLLDKFNLLESMPLNSASAKWYRLKINQDGLPARNSQNALREHEFQNMLHEVQQLILSVADQIASGRIDPVPYRYSSENACLQCKFQAACPFDRLYGQYHDIRKQPVSPPLLHTQDLHATEPDGGGA